MPNRKEAPKGTHAKRPDAADRGAAAPKGSFRAPSPNVLALIAGFAAGALYLPAAHYGWVWDDALLASTRGAGGAAAEGLRPVLALLQRGEWLLGAGNPALFHVTNLLVHAIGAWLFVHLAIQLGAPSALAFVVSLLFGAHPVHVESVAFVSGRGAMLASVLSMGALLAARSPSLLRPEGARSRSIALAWLLFAAAAFTHEAALAAPFLLLGLDRWGAERVSFRARRLHYAGFAVIWLAALLLPMVLRAATPAPTLSERGLPEGQPFQAVLLSAASYLAMLAWPHPLNAIRTLTVAAASSAGAWMPLALGVLAVAGIVAWRRGDALARVGALTLGLGLVPILPYPWATHPFAAERLAYLPSVGACFLALSCLAGIGRARGAAASAAAALALVTAGAAAVASLQRMPVWEDNIALLRATAEATPQDAEPWVRLAEQHAARGDAASALAALDKAIERDSTRAESYSRRALVLGTLGRWLEAESSARRATELEPKNAEAWGNLGDALAQQGRAAEAVTASRRAVELDSTQALLWYNLGVSLAALQDVPGAAGAYERALAIDSTNVGAWNNLGALYGGLGRLEEARHAYAKAVEIAPGSLQAHMNLALAYLRLGDREQAALERKTVQRMSPSAARQLAELFQEADAAAKAAAPAQPSKSPPKR